MSGRTVTVGARRRWPRWLLAVLLVGPVLELVLIAVVAQQAGAGWTVLLLVLGFVVGLALLVREVPRSWRGLRDATGFGRPVVVDGAVVDDHAAASAPQVGERLLDGGVVLVGAALVLLPGFLSDVLGILCLLPLTRAVPRRVLAGLVRRRAARFGGSVHVDGVRVDRSAPPRQDPLRQDPLRKRTAGEVLQGEVVDDDRR